MRTVAVTGGIGSGKSAVCSMLASRGIPVYDSDSAAKRLYRDDDSILDSIEAAFGKGVRFPDGSPDFRKMASIVFSSPDALKTLESIVHPAVLKDFIRWEASKSAMMEGAEAGPEFFGGEPFCVLESAIILEKPEFLSHMDKVVLVDAPLKTRLERACGRDGADPSEVIKRMAVQRFDLSRADAILRNDSTLENLSKEVEKVFGSLFSR